MPTFKYIIILLYLFSTCVASKAQQTVLNWAEPINLNSLNTHEDEFAPSWNKFDSVLYFNSTISGWSKFYTTKKLDTTNFTTPELLPDEINQSRNNQSYITFYNENIAYISSFRQGARRSYLNIFQTERKRKQWAKPYPADSLVYDGFTGHPTVSDDGSFIVFSSDRFSETGDADLFMAFLQDNGTWGSVVNLSELNSNGNEITPFLLNNDTLFFATDGQEGPGGYDIFYSVRNQGTWDRPTPIYQLNTRFDESDFVVLPDGSCLFSSNRPGGKGGLDLYLTRRYETEIKRKEFISELELSIAAQVSSIKSNADTLYEYFQLIPYIFHEIENYKYLSPSILQINKNLDTINFSTIDIISQRLKNYPSAKIYIYPILYDISSTDSLKANELADVMHSFFNIQKSRIVISTPVTLDANNTFKSFLLLDSEEPRIFEPLELGTSQIILDPPALDIYLNARPLGLLKSWICNLYINDKMLLTVDSGKTLPVSFSIDLKRFAEKIHSADSLIIELSTLDTLGNSVIKRIPFNVTHTESKTRKLQTQNDKDYEQHFLVLAPITTDADRHPSRNCFNDYIKKIVQSIEISKSIKIVYYEKKSQKMAENLKDELLRKTFRKIEIVQDKYSKDLPFSQDLSPYVFKIMLEK